MIATQTIPIFFALEPDERVARLVERYKASVRELVGNQLYLADPPHMTLYLAMFDDIDHVVGLARQCARSITRPRVAIRDWHTFLADPLTGLNTLVLDFCDEHRQRLRAIQARVIEAVATSRDAPTTLDRLNGRWKCLSPQERETACRWGFPYVHEGWHPHLTIASIHPDDWPTIESTVLGEIPSANFECPRLQVFQLIDNKPHLLESFELAPAQEESQRVSNPVPIASLGNSATSCQTTPDCDVASLKQEIIAALWNVVDHHDWILSTTITGSFLTDDSLASISDIDTVVVVDSLNDARFDQLQHECADSLEPLLARHGLKLRINPTLGPLKFNDDSTAVLHLMLYSGEAHRQHVIHSPFTCYDWQRSSIYRKRSIASIYPVFALQPHHFISSRRGILDYLQDFERSVISYRELVCHRSGYDEMRHEAPMSARDRYEYAYHVMRFLMQNLLKLLERNNAPLDGEQLTEQFAAEFPKNVDAHMPLYLELRRRKKARDFRLPIPRLADRLREFVADFESQFRQIFIETATRHIVFRHAPTLMNQGQGEGQTFLGRSDPDIMSVSETDVVQLAQALRQNDCKAVYTSPLKRCRQTIKALGNALAQPPVIDSRLVEIDYGRCEGFTLGEARRTWPELFTSWSRGEDPSFPGGECTGDVWSRAYAFIDEVWRKSPVSTATCTHNVVLRCLVGQGLGVPRSEWHRIRIPHLVPISFVQTRQHGWFVDLDESVEARLLDDFLDCSQGAR